jgi:hypothetical protein
VTTTAATGFRLGLAVTVAVWLWTVGALIGHTPAEPLFRAVVIDASRALWAAIAVAVALFVPVAAALPWRGLAAGTLVLLAVPAPFVALAGLMGAFAPSVLAAAVALLIAASAGLGVVSHLAFTRLQWSGWWAPCRGGLQFTAAAAMVLYHRPVLAWVLG